MEIASAPYWRLRAALWLASALVVTACATPPIARLPEAGAETPCITPIEQHDIVVGVSFSGGGSRAALFGAGGLEALGRMRAPNGGSVLADVIRATKVALNQGAGGPVDEISAYGFKKPPMAPKNPADASRNLANFILGIK